MKRKLLPIMAVIALLSGAFTLQACFYSGPGGWYGSGPVAEGDYDEGHVWHDRYWWVQNRHDWVHQNHPDWVAHETPEEHAAYSHHH